MASGWSWLASLLAAFAAIVRVFARRVSGFSMIGKPLRYLSVKTIETHRAAAMRKLNVTSTAAIVRYAIRNKLVEP
jgi:FixJ family two-component response regulator